MPNYELKCANPECEHVFERVVRLNEPLGKCPRCLCPEVDKVPSSPGIIFRGPGWTSKGR